MLSTICVVVLFLCCLRLTYVLNVVRKERDQAQQDARWLGKELNAQRELSNRERLKFDERRLESEAGIREVESIFTKFRLEFQQKIRQL